MPSGTHSESLQVGGTVFNRTKTLTADNLNVSGDATSPITLPVGHTVTSWVKTDSDTAACVLPDDHGCTSGKYDVYDSDGIIIRYGVDGVVTDDALDLDGGTVGEEYSGGFPATATAGIVVSKQKQVNVSIDGDLASLIGFELADVQGHVDCQDKDGASIKAHQLNADDAVSWDSQKKLNPYEGNTITKLRVSNGDASSTGALRVVVLQDSTIWPSTSPSASVSASPSASVSATPSASPSASVSASVSATPSASPSASVSASPSASVSASVSASPSASVSASPSASPSASVSASPSQSPSSSES